MLTSDTANTDTRTIFVTGEKGGCGKAIWTPEMLNVLARSARSRNTPSMVGRKRANAPIWPKHVQKPFKRLRT